MRLATRGDTVKVRYRGKLHDGSVFDDTSDREPLQFTIGEGEVIPGFEEAVVGMKPGESKTAELPVETAFGPYRDDMVVVVPKSRFTHLDPDPTVGQRVPVPQPEGPPVELIVTEVTESAVTVDANHPLAGEALTIDIQLVDIVHGAH
jgi:FKBP-type peptidyl-prolyl cis-trans isomerase 2